MQLSVGLKTESERRGGVQKEMYGKRRKVLYTQYNTQISRNAGPKHNVIIVALELCCV